MFVLMGLVSVVFLTKGLWWCWATGRAEVLWMTIFHPLHFLVSPDSCVHHNFACYLKIGVPFKTTTLLSSPLTCPKKLLDISLKALYIKILVLFMLCSTVSTLNLL